MARGDHQKEKVMIREQRILECLSQGPKAVKQIAADIGASPSSVAIYLARLHAEPKRAYVCGHAANGKGLPTPLWDAGNMPDAEFVPLRRPTRKTSASERREQVLDLLTKKPCTLIQLAPLMCVCRGAAGRYITELRQPENRQVFILKWLHPKQAYPGSKACTWIPVYAVGSKPDAPMPKKESSAARHARLHKDKAYREERQRKRRLYYAVSKAKSKPQNPFSALGL